MHILDVWCHSTRWSRVYYKIPVIFPSMLCFLLYFNSVAAFIIHLQLVLRVCVFISYLNWILRLITNWIASKWACQLHSHFVNGFYLCIVFGCVIKYSVPLFPWLCIALILPVNFARSVNYDNRNQDQTVTRLERSRKKIHEKMVELICSATVWIMQLIFLTTEKCLHDGLVVGTILQRRGSYFKVSFGYWIKREILFSRRNTFIPNICHVSARIFCKNMIGRCIK